MKAGLHHIENNIPDIRQKKKALGLIINPVLQKFILLDKEITEVMQIGKFLYKIDPKLRITDKPSPPSPDFILSIDNKTIGLEHTQIIDKINAQKYFSILNLFKDAAKIFQKQNPDKKFAAVFRVQNDALTYQQKNKKKLIEIINLFVLDTINGKHTLQPDFITEIQLNEYDGVSYTYLEDHFHAKPLTIKELKQAISIKEEKLEKYYRQSSSIQEFWLVLMVGSHNSASFEPDDKINYKTSSVFDKVFLMEDFKDKIIRVK